VAARKGKGGRGHGLLLASAELFAHLQQYKSVGVDNVLQQRDAVAVHPAILALGLRYADGSIKGSTARCVAMINALSQVRLLQLASVRKLCLSKV
jgi:hypothetical protein